MPKVVLLIFVSGKVVLTGEQRHPWTRLGSFKASLLPGRPLSWLAQVPRRAQTCIRPLS